MVSVRYCRRSADGVSPETVQLPASCLTQPVATVRAAAAHMLGLAPSQLELVFRGRPLVNDRLMTSYELNSSSVLHAFRRPPPPADDAAATRSADAPDGTQLAWTLQQLTQDPVRRHTVTQRLGRPEVLQRLLRAVPALESDPIALALLQEPALLLQVASPRANVKRLVAAHPVLADMAGPLAAVLRACERNPGPAGGSASGASQSRAPPAAAAADERAGDQGSFDDDEDEDDDEPGVPVAAAAGAGAVGGASVPPITREQLASALAAAVPNLAAASAAAAAAVGGSAGQSPASRPGSGRSAAPAMQQSTTPPQQQQQPQQQQPASAQPMGVISPQMVSAALREAMRALPTAQRTAPAPQVAQQQSPAQPPPQPVPVAPAPAADPPAVQQPAVNEAAVRQLLELGITTNESLVRQALLFSEGNIDHAVEFIYASLQ